MSSFDKVHLLYEVKTLVIQGKQTPVGITMSLLVMMEKTSGPRETSLRQRSAEPKRNSAGVLADAFGYRNTWTAVRPTVSSDYTFFFSEYYHWGYVLPG
jgi:hypothetical protein